MKYNQKLPKAVELQLDNYIQRIKDIKWFKPSADLKKEDIEKQVNISLEAFGVKAGIEYRSLKTEKDWDAARDAARDAAWDAAWGAAWDAAWGAARGAAWDAAWGAAWDAAWDAARGAARGAAWDAAWDAARGAADVLALNLDEYKKKYPNGNFINLIALWEMGLYPCGVIEGKFVIYIPE
jgi:hypothetical protein